MFNDDYFEAGCEFTSEFISNLKPQLFLSNNVIIDYGDNCEYLYMIQENIISLSLRIDKINMYKKTNLTDCIFE